MNSKNERESSVPGSCMGWRSIDGIYLFVVIALALIIFLPKLGSFGLLDPSDALYSEGAREMVESGNYITPSVNYLPFFEKPILIYWLIAASYRLFGISELAARPAEAI